MIPQVPPYLLPDSMTVRVPVEGERGGCFSDERVSVDHVRFIDRAEVRRGAYVFEEGSKGLVIVDYLNSAGAFDIPAGSLLSINGGDEVAVVKAVPHKTYRGRVHHWELEVR
ncbi:hypothetical protein AALA69_03285 [Eggerthellaceae bacterium 24-137]